MRRSGFTEDVMDGGIAQLVERGTENPGVPSSILGPATTFLGRPYKRLS